MPHLDKTRAIGLGSQTGRKRGQCNKPSDDVMEFTPRGRKRNRVGFGFANRGNADNNMVQEFGKGCRKGRGNGRGRVEKIN